MVGQKHVLTVYMTQDYNLKYVSGVYQYQTSSSVSLGIDIISNFTIYIQYHRPNLLYNTTHFRRQSKLKSPTCNSVLRRTVKISTIIADLQHYACIWWFLVPLALVLWSHWMSLNELNFNFDLICTACTQKLQSPQHYKNYIGVS